MKAQGVAFIYISHRLDEIARVADRIAVIRDGNLIAVHDSGQVPVKTLVSEMVGRSVERMFPALSTYSGHEALRVENLTSPTGKFKQISFAVQAGEVFGISGIVGAGRTELVRAIFGADAVSEGSIYVEGQKISITNPRHAIEAGIVLVPEDRKQQGLIIDHEIGDNVMYGNFDLLNTGGWATPSTCAELASEAIRKMRTKGNVDQKHRHFPEETSRRS
ncbi:ATP-binding cassette domain-containing protein [Vibrio sp. PP-XX7]